MDTTSVELARQGLAQYEQDLSPVYTGIQEQLLGVLAVNGRLLEDLQVETDHANANARLVRDFTVELPHGYTNIDESGRLTNASPVIPVADALSARLVQTHVAWRKRENYYNRFIPYYIIGTKSVEPAKKHHPDASILLAPAVKIKGRPQFNVPFTAVPVHRNELDAAEFVQGKALFETYTEEDMHKMFNPQTKKIDIRNNTTGSLVIDAWFYEKLPRKLRKQTPRELINTITNTRTINGPNADLERGDWKDTFYTRLSNQMMAEYNVPHYLNRLATAFGKTALLDKLLEQHTVKAISPVDQLTQS